VERASGSTGEPSAGSRNLVFVVLDSLRYDSWISANPSVLASLGPVERRWSYATWTAPSHYNLLMGLLPHSSPPEVYASEYYKQDFVRYRERLGQPDMEFRKLLPSLYLPSYLRQTLGYRTHAMVSMPVLNERTILNRDFDCYRLMPTHNDMAAMLDEMTFDDDRPSFHLLNVGETHYPYALPDEDPSEWPRISGVHGVFKRLDPAEQDQPQPTEPQEFFDQSALKELQDRQIHAVEYLDTVFAKLFDLLPSNTWVIVTSDHGELFGEDRYFGHGPIMHEKVLEVPFVEGLVP
jgi:sulfatase-like protein